MSISLQSILLLLLLLNLHEYLFFILFVLGKSDFLQNYHFSLIICAHVCVIFFILFSDILYFRVELISHMWSLDMKHISMKLALECCLFYNIAFFNLHVFFSQLCCKFLFFFFLMLGRLLQICKICLQAEIIKYVKNKYVFTSKHKLKNICSCI